MGLVSLRRRAEFTVSYYPILEVHDLSVDLRYTSGVLWTWCSHRFVDTDDLNFLPQTSTRRSYDQRRGVRGGTTKVSEVSPPPSGRCGGSPLNYLRKVNEVVQFSTGKHFCTFVRRSRSKGVGRRGVSNKLVGGPRRKTRVRTVREGVDPWNRDRQGEQTVRQEVPERTDGDGVNPDFVLETSPWTDVVWSSKKMEK